jgi:signal transduction histidine kinase
VTDFSTPKPRSGAWIYTVGLAFVGSLIVLLIALTLVNVQKLFEGGRLVQHSADVNEEIQATFSALQDAETGQRGYLLTGKPEYLNPYHAAIRDVHRHLQAVEAIVEIPTNRALVPHLTTLVGDKIRELQDTIDLRDRSGAMPALAMVQTDVGNRLMEEIRAICSEIKTKTRQRLDERIVEFRRAADVARRDLEIGGGLLLILLVLFAMLIRRHLRARRRYEGRILESQADLQRALGIRDTFLSVAGHEFRTPISVLSLTLENLVRKARKGETLKATDMEAPMRQADRLARLTETLLDVRRIASGHLDLEPEEMDLAALAREVAARLHPQALEARAPLSVSAEQPVVGTWDRLRLEQVLMNLLSNAIKFGRGAPVEFRVFSENGGAVVEVRDGGIGIDPKDQDRIFERFERAASAQSYRGMGLGLWICRELVGAHQGRITVQSASGQGSLFRVELPGSGG